MNRKHDLHWQFDVTRTFNRNENGERSENCTEEVHQICDSKIRGNKGKEAWISIYCSPAINIFTGVHRHSQTDMRFAQRNKKWVNAIVLISRSQLFLVSCPSLDLLLSVEQQRSPGSRCPANLSGREYATVAGSSLLRPCLHLEQREEIIVHSFA